VDEGIHLLVESVKGDLLGIPDKGLGFGIENGVSIDEIRECPQRVTAQRFEYQFFVHDLFLQENGRR